MEEIREKENIQVAQNIFSLIMKSLTGFEHVLAYYVIVFHRENESMPPCVMSAQIITSIENIV